MSEQNKRILIYAIIGTVVFVLIYVAYSQSQKPKAIDGGSGDEGDRASDTPATLYPKDES